MSTYPTSTYHIELILAIDPSRPTALYGFNTIEDAVAVARRADPSWALGVTVVHSMKMGKMKPWQIRRFPIRQQVADLQT